LEAEVESFEVAEGIVSKVAEAVPGVCVAASVTVEIAREAIVWVEDWPAN